jgi:hypothetical protein
MQERGPAENARTEWWLIRIKVGPVSHLSLTGWPGPPICIRVNKPLGFEFVRIETPVYRCKSIQRKYKID